MKKVVLLLMAFLMPALMANAETRTVNNQDELLKAIADADVDTIVLGSNIETTQKINITRDVYLDGKGHTIKYVGTFGENNSKDNTVWGGIYVLQFYKNTATLKDIKLTGANAAVLVNGALVTFMGDIDVSGNGFGGIELGQGAGVTEIPKLSLTKAKIINTTEASGRPTLWVPDDTSKAVLEVDGVEKEVKTDQEITLAQFNQMFGIEEENPNTGDYLVVYITLGLMSLLGLGLAVNTIIKKDY